MPKQTPIYQIKITLDQIRPPIWRRFQVPGNATLLKFSDILQVVMGWTNTHLHQFTIAGEYYGNPEFDDYGEPEMIPEDAYKLSQVIPGEGFRFEYDYDYGDGWAHTLVVEKIDTSEKRENRPVCLEGKRACPPEDIGGVWGYQDFINTLKDPNHDNYDQYLMWVGGEFDPEKFDIEAVNASLRKLSHSPSASVWEIDEWRQTAWNDYVKSATELPQCMEEFQDKAENLPLRRDMIALLNYIRDNRITGASTTGNLPLKAVREIAAMMVDPPVLDTTYGNHSFKLRSEEEVWPLYFRHVLAVSCGLISGGPGRRWHITPFGERFLATPALLQLTYLIKAYWTQMDWDFATMITLGGRDDQEMIQTDLIEYLFELPTNESIQFNLFAGRLIEEIGLTNPVNNENTAKMMLRRFIKQLIIDPFKELGIMECAYQPHKEFGDEFKELSTIKITQMGRDFLNVISSMA